MEIFNAFKKQKSRILMTIIEKHDVFDVWYTEIYACHNKSHGESNSSDELNDSDEVSEWKHFF